MQKVVLITGASTGIGFDCVRTLVENQFLVVATVRKDEDEKKLKEKFGQSVKVIKLEVKNLHEVEQLPKKLNEMGVYHLDGLVNNAGIALAAPFLNHEFSEVQETLQVNVISLMKVTQVLLPMLGANEKNENPGRIVNISSVAGKSGVPFLATYVASKHAVEGFSESLGRELALFGIKVIVIGPGSIQTPIWQKGFSSIKEKYNNTMYSFSFRKFIEMSLQEEQKGLKVEDVSAMVLKALTSKCPKKRYAPVPRKWLNVYLPALMPKALYNYLILKVLGLLPKKN